MPKWEYRKPVGRFFSPEQRRQVAVLLEAIFPGGADNPGAIDADAVEYVDRLLAMDAATYYDIPKWKAQYANGLPLVAAAAAAKFDGAKLEDLTVDQATTLLADLAVVKLPGPAAPPWQAELFATIRTHAIEACFADQRWGGNRNNVIWQWYGYPSGPSVEYYRTVRNAPPAGAETPSGQTGTATNPIEEIESATVLPDLLEEAARRNRATRPGTPFSPSP